jgi:hypothetical protein
MGSNTLRPPSMTLNARPSSMNPNEQTSINYETIQGKPQLKIKSKETTLILDFHNDEIKKAWKKEMDLNKRWKQENTLIEAMGEGIIDVVQATSKRQQESSQEANDGMKSINSKTRFNIFKKIIK